MPKDMLTPNAGSGTLPSSERLKPLAVGAGLLAAGVLLWRYPPTALNIPDPLPLNETPHRSFWRRAARRSRDGVAKVAPANIGVSLGRSLVIAGTALMITRVLDELAGWRD